MLTTIIIYTLRAYLLVMLVLVVKGAIEFFRMYPTLDLMLYGADKKVREHDIDIRLAFLFWLSMLSWLSPIQ